MNYITKCYYKSYSVNICELATGSIPALGRLRDEVPEGEALCRAEGQVVHRNERDQRLVAVHIHHLGEGIPDVPAARGVLLLRLLHLCPHLLCVRLIFRQLGADYLQFVGRARAQLRAPGRGSETAVVSEISKYSR